MTPGFGRRKLGFQRLTCFARCTPGFSSLAFWTWGQQLARLDHPADFEHSEYASMPKANYLCLCPHLGKYKEELPGSHHLLPFRYPSCSESNGGEAFTSALAGGGAVLGIGPPQEHSTTMKDEFAEVFTVGRCSPNCTVPAKRRTVCAPPNSLDFRGERDFRPTWASRVQQEAWKRGSVEASGVCLRHSALGPPCGCFGEPVKPGVVASATHRPFMGPATWAAHSSVR